MIPTPAYDLPPIARALKFDDFDWLCVRLLEWTGDDATLPGGYEGEVSIERGAVPQLELEDVR